MKNLSWRHEERAKRDQAISAVATGGSQSRATLPSNVSGSLSTILRPQAAYRWLLPQLAAITPQYIETVLRGALAGSHVQAWELFDLMEDSWPHLGHCIQQIKRAVANLSPSFSAYREEEEEPSESAVEKMRLCSAAWRGLKPVAAADENGERGTIFDLMDAWFKGQVVLETDWQMSATPKLGQFIAPRATRWVHPICYAWDMQGRLGLRADSQGRLTPGMLSNTSYQPLPSVVADFPPDKFLIGIAKAKSGSALGGALLRPLAWWWCAANFSADWLLNLAQIFGLPFRMANYDPNAPQVVVDGICNMLQNMGNSGWAAFPNGTTLDFKEASGRATFSPQADLLDRADKAASLLVLGQTLTGDTGGGGKGGGSLALGKVHEGVKQEIIVAASRYVAEVIQCQLFPSVLRLNYGTDDECPTVEFISEEEEDLTAKAGIVKILADAGAGSIIGMGWLGKTFSIPTPAPEEKTLEKLLPAVLPPVAEAAAAPSSSARKKGADPMAAGDFAGHPFRGNQHVAGTVSLQDERWNGSPKDMHLKAKALMKTFGPVEHPELGTVRFSRDGIDKTLYDKRTPHEFQSVQALPKLIQNGKITSSMEDRKGRPEVAAFHTLESRLRIGDAHYRVDTTIKQTQSGGVTAQKFYLHRLRDPGVKGKEIASGPYSVTRPKPGHGPAGKGTLAHVAGAVNQEALVTRLGEILALEDDAAFEAALKAHAATL